MPDDGLELQKPATPAERPGRRLSSTAGFFVAAYLIGLGFFTSVAPSPLYQTYARRWGFEPLTLTLIYATYAIALLVALLLIGRLSDDVGRRPVLLVALAVLIAATFLFIFADSAVWLFFGRAFHGLATGAIISTAGAALLDLQRNHDPVVVSVTNGVSSNAGLGLGILLVSALVQLNSSPLVLPYIVLLVLLVIGLLAVLWMPEPVTERRRPQLSPERPEVPPVARAPFVLAALAVMASWSIAGLFFSLGPQLGARLFDTSTAIMASSGIFSLLGAAALAQLVLGRTTPWVAASVGSLLLAAGMVIIAVAAASGRGGLYLAGSIVSGVGFGLSFLGGLRGLVGSIPPQHRAGVLSAFYIVGYLSLSIPAIVAGIVVGPLGLNDTFVLFAVIAAVLATVVAVLAVRTRPAPKHAFG